MNDTDLMSRWLNSLSSDRPDPALVASLEAEAATRGWDPRDVFNGMVAARGGGVVHKIGRAIADWNPDLHPRGNDGQFIETGGIVRVSGKPKNRDLPLRNQRAEVERIIPDPNDPGNPDIQVRLVDPNTGHGSGMPLIVKPHQVADDPTKAVLRREPPRDLSDLAEEDALAGRPWVNLADKMIQNIPQMSDEELASHLAVADDGRFRAALVAERRRRSGG